MATIEPVTSIITAPRVEIVRHILSGLVTVSISSYDTVVSTTLTPGDVDSAEIILVPEPALENVVRVLDLAANRVLATALRCNFRGDVATHSLLAIAANALQAYHSGWLEAMTEEKEHTVATPLT